MNARNSAKIICITGFFFWTYLLLYKYYHLGYYDWDFAFFAQAMWNLCHGSCHVSLFDINFFANHANLIALVLVPFYKIFPHPVTLLILKLISFSIASYMLYLIAEEKLGPRSALFILCLYWLCPANIYGLVYEFDFENLAPAFIMLTFYYYTKERWIPFLVSSFFLIIIKENMPLIIAAFGIHGLFTKSDKMRWGWIPTFLGGCSFYVLAFVFVPLMGGHGLGQHPYGGHYSDLNSNLLMHPWEAVQNIVTVKKIRWLQYLFGPLFLSLFSCGILFLGFPIMLQHFLSNMSQEHTLRYGYMLTIMPFIFLAFTNTLGWIKKTVSKAKFYLILCILIALNIFYLSSQMEFIENRYMDFSLPDQSVYKWQLLKMVPPQAEVIASFAFLPELSQRPYLYSFHKMYDPGYQNEKHPYKLPQNVHYALIDFNDDWLLGRLEKHKQTTILNIRKFVAQGGWKIKYVMPQVILFER